MDEPTAMIFDVKHFAIHDGAGIRSTVFFKGCPLRCRWCHNPEGIEAFAQIQYAAEKCVNCGECAGVCPNGAQAARDGKHVFLRDKCDACGKCAERCPANAVMLAGKRTTVDEALSVCVKDRLFYEKSGGGVTLSGGECLMQADFCGRLLKRLKAEGVNTAVDTCGYVSWAAFTKVAPYTDMFLFDVKHIDSAAHKAYTGVGNELILDNLRRLDALGSLIEVRIPLIPGINDDEKTLTGIAALLSGLKNITRARLLRYNNLAGSKYSMLGLASTQPNVQPQSDEEMLERKALLERFDLNVVF